MQCKNCRKTLGTLDSYCSDCGAKVIDKRITMGYLATEMREGFFSIDSSKPIRTFFHLFTKPEIVIGGYINGVRKKYIHAFGYFTLALTLSSFFFFIFLKWFPEMLDFSVDPASYQEDQTAEQLKFQKEFVMSFYEYSSLVFFLTIPLTALISRLIFLKNKKFNYAEHLIINLYSYSHISIVITLLYLLTIWNQSLFMIIGACSVVLQVAFYCFVLKRLYKLTIGQTLLKLLLFLLIMTLTILLVTIIGILIGFFIGAFDDFAEKTVAANNAVSYIASSTINWTS